MCEAQTAEQRRDEFAEELFEKTIGAMEVASVYLGDRLGLYRALAEGGPATTAELAERTGTHERYAREWLEQQAVTGILAVEDDAADGSARRYTLPEGHAEVLLDKDSLNYLAPVARFTMGLVRPLPALVDAFHAGEGLPYPDYGADAREDQADANRPMFVNLLGSEWLPSVPDVHERVHGTAADHGRWRAVLPAFEQRFAVVAVDRRGRGGSGDSDGYEIQWEFEDVAAVVDSLGEPAFLLGHSYGGLVALEAALLTENVRNLVLYDPGIEVTGEEVSPQDVIERLETLLEAGDRDGVVETTMREVAGLPPETVEYMRSQPAWQARVAAAHTIPRELRAVKAYGFDPVRGSRGIDAGAERGR